MYIIYIIIPRTYTHTHTLHRPQARQGAAGVCMWSRDGGGVGVRVRWRAARNICRARYNVCTRRITTRPRGHCTSYTNFTFVYTYYVRIY
jgi:hypothetical protein